ncbi:MAG TPA: F0F1 ATP synthase subunit B [Alphaproteobacteria bacterium]|nr:F0F1 ATP synthase subunit B [Alphaproteobacteria bacterium]
MQAFAAEKAVDIAANGESWLEAVWRNPELWVAVAFVILVGGAFRKVYAIITAALDKRAETIHSQIEEARKLREEAQDLLAAFERKQREAASEAKEIEEAAHREAAHQNEKAKKELSHSLERLEIQAKERIAQAEADAIAQVSAATAEAAIEAARNLLAERLHGERADALIEASTDIISEKLN